MAATRTAVLAATPAAAPAATTAATTAATATEGSPSKATLAKGALRRLAQAQLEPTPENYARAYADESGLTAPAAGVPAIGTPDVEHQLTRQGQVWAALVERLAKGLERGGRQWTMARRKEGLKRVLDGSRSDAQRLLQRLQSLLGAWDGDAPSDRTQTGADDPPAEFAVPGPDAGAWQHLVATLEDTVRAGLPSTEPRAAALAAQLAVLAQALAASGPTPQRVAEIAAVCEQARRLFAHRHHLIEALGLLCQEFTASLTELTENDSWARGQCQMLRAHLGDGAGQDLTLRGVRAASAVLAEARHQQQRVLDERLASRDALKKLIHSMLLEVGELGAHTGRFQLATARHVDAIGHADSVESLAGVVKAMLDDARTVQSAVGRSQERLQADHAHATQLEAKVRELEVELLRLSEEVSTDALTQVANRRGLMQAFEAESARHEREECSAGGAAPLAVGLIDIDNFKKLNDSLGHAAGDMALKTLAGAVREHLRPADHLARFGGEEFVVLLPGTGLAEAQQALTRLQRNLSVALFLHDGREVFVTFSAGVTTWRRGELLQTTLERADEALYEAKRTGKNRTCTG